MADTEQSHKKHIAPRVGKSHDKKHASKLKKQGIVAKPTKLNNKAFGGSGRDNRRELQRKLDRQERNAHIPKNDRLLVLATPSQKYNGIRFEPKPPTSPPSSKKSTLGS